MCVCVCARVCVSVSLWARVCSLIGKASDRYQRSSGALQPGVSSPSPVITPLSRVQPLQVSGSSTVHPTHRLPSPPVGSSENRPPHGHPGNAVVESSRAPGPPLRVRACSAGRRVGLKNAAAITPTKAHLRFPPTLSERQNTTVSGRTGRSYPSSPPHSVTGVALRTAGDSFSMLVLVLVMWRG